MAAERVIDVSDNQGFINWAEVKASDIVFAVLRSVRRSGKADNQFDRNVRGCRANGMGFDAYKYSYAQDVTSSIKEAEQVVSLLRSRGCGQEVTVWWDMEDKSLRGLGKSQLTRNINAARSVIEAAGYTFGIYCNQDWYDNVLDVDAFDCPFWVARYGKNDGEPHIMPNVRNTLWGWQYTSRGRVPGINGNVDLSILYDIYGWSDKPERMTVRRGSRGPAVREMQLLLIAAGYSCGDSGPDGIFGSDTYGAVVRYQIDHDLDPDGIVGPLTWAELTR